MSSNVYVSPTDLYVNMMGSIPHANPWVGFLQEGNPMSSNSNVDITPWENPHELPAYEILEEPPVPMPTPQWAPLQQANNPMSSLPPPPTQTPPQNP